MSGVKIWEENVVIPTYGIGAADKNPMFLESRVYQGSSGRIYPYPTIEKIYDEKEDKTYHAVWLENEYLKVMIRPDSRSEDSRPVRRSSGGGAAAS